MSSYLTPFTRKASLALLMVAAANSGAMATSLTSDTPLTNYADSTMGSGPIQLSLEPSSYTVTFSNGGYIPNQGSPNRVGGIVGALNIGNIQITQEGHVDLTESALSANSTRSTRYNVAFTGPVDALQINTSTHSLDEVAMSGGITLSTTYGNGLDKVSIDHLRANIHTGVVTADLAYSTSELLNPGASFVAKDVQLWQASELQTLSPLQPGSINALFEGNAAPITADGYTLTAIEKSTITPGTVTYVNGNAIYDPYYINYGYGSPYPIGYVQVPVTTGGVYAVNAHLSKAVTLKGLHLTDAGMSTLMRAEMGPSSEFNFALDAIQTQPEGWGSISATLNISASVPEPSTYLLMGLGLVGISAVARRRQQA